MNFEVDTQAPPGLSKQRLRVWLQMLRATRYVEAQVRERLRENFAITLPQFDVMAALYQSEAGLTMTQLSRALRVSNGNVTGIVDRLAESGMLARHPSARDRRTMRVSLTTRGHNAFAHMAEIHEGWIDGLLAPLDEAEAGALRDLLSRIGTHRHEGAKP